MSVPLRLGLAGVGTVGAEVTRRLAEDGARIATRTGRGLEPVAWSARAPDKDRGVDLTGLTYLPDARALALVETVDVVVELIGGADGVARDLVVAALENGKHVVTANKALLAEHGPALARLAEANRCHLLYEAAVAGGIPIVKAVREGLVGNRMSDVSGILNGTCNYILTEMESRGADFDSVLADAMAHGYAEADPTFDIDGTDAAHKLVILASLAFGIEVNLAGVEREGIDAITQEDIASAAAIGYRIKLLATAERTDEGVALSVGPALVPHSAPLAHVGGPENAVCVIGEAVGRTVYQGAGAGAGPTASAVLADLGDIARGLPPQPVFGKPVAELEPAPFLPRGRRATASFLRLKVADRPRVTSAIADILGAEEISIDVLHQPHHAPKEAVSILLTTHPTHAASLQRALDRLATHEAVLAPPRVLTIATN